MALRLLIPATVSGILPGDAVGHLREVGHRNELRDSRGLDPRWIVRTIHSGIRNALKDLRWIVPRKKQAIHQSVVFDPQPAVASIGFRKSKLHSAEIRPLREMDVHGGWLTIHLLDQLAKDAALGRDQLVDPQHRQVILHRFDIGSREAVGSHVDTILRTDHGIGSVSIEQGVRPECPLVFQTRPARIEIRIALGNRRDPLKAPEMLVDDGMQHCLNLRP